MDTSRYYQNRGVKFFSRLKTRMAISYVVVTLIIVLLLEGLVLTVVFWAFTRSPFIGFLTMDSANNAAQIYALEAAVQADDGDLNTNITFEPGQSNSLSYQQDFETARFTDFHMNIEYIEPGSTAPDRPAFALLIGRDGEIIASSYPDRYPVSTSVEQVLPGENEIIRSSLSGIPDSVMQDTSQGNHVSVAQTVWSRDREVLGSVYIQAPAGGLPNTNLLTQVIGVLIPSSIAWLCLMLPIGMLFGVLTMSGVIKRIERLGRAAATFTSGDFSQRVPVRRADEIGQLELQFNEMAEQLVNSIAQRQALAEQSARREERARIEQEMKSAHYIQKSLLPDYVPSLSGWHIEPFYRPAREVGGDLYDFLTLPGDQIGIVIGDVTGKGMPAALIMATTTAMIRAAAPGTVSPGEVLKLVNNLLVDNIPPTMFATCFYAVLDQRSGRLRFANAGHDIPYLSRNGDVLELRARGMPLGLIPDQTYSEKEIIISRDDLVLFYTDGLVEAHNGNHEMFGFPRLKSLLQNNSHTDGVVNYLLNELHRFTGKEWEQEDDVTMVAVRKID